MFLTKQTSWRETHLYAGLLLGGMLLVAVFRGGGHPSGIRPGSRRYVLTDLGVISKASRLQRDHSRFPHAYFSMRNARGQTAGWYPHNADGSHHAALWQQGKRQDLGTLGGKTSYATAINNGTQVAGYSALPNSCPHAFLWQNGTMKDLGTLGGRNSWARALNSRGMVTGEADTDNGATHAFVYYQGVMQDLGTLGGGESAAWNINDQGQIVGEAETRAGDLHAFLYTDEGMSDLNQQIGNCPDWTLVTATDIDNAGCIRGIGVLHNAQHFFLLTPVRGA